MASLTSLLLALPSFSLSFSSHMHFSSTLVPVARYRATCFDILAHSCCYSPASLSLLSRGAGKRVTANEDFARVKGKCFML